MTDFPEAPIYEHLARVGKALAAPVRLRLLDLLDQGECTVEELARRGGLPLKNTSAQLQQLRAAGLVTSRREGTHVHYALRDEEVSRFLGRFQDFSEQRMGGLREEVERHLGREGGSGAVTSEELAQMVAHGEAVVVDLRSTREFAQGHVPGAVSVPSGSWRGGSPSCRGTRRSSPTARAPTASCHPAPSVSSTPRAAMRAVCGAATSAGGASGARAEGPPPEERRTTRRARSRASRVVLSPWTLGKPTTTRGAKPHTGGLGVAPRGDDETTR
ncbi:metalloregulator ArsR/SmtB family transcription factor [Nocardiopsis sp. CNR-923]|uniref:ArsR/SmtB family transcription factor n=1 Tax=Nocardiopsis sp. CNR-923 TaxID=1904965 RepID=UPI0021CCDD23|nr:metalloregulator ArsR/SmtB family transcription factor [Nocardiopsis sp. CNR-923]